MKEQFFVVSDESGTDDNNQYKSVAFVSGTQSEITSINRFCKETLSNLGVSELKWNKIGSSERLQATLTILDHFFRNTQARVLVLSWDITDSRHAVAKRDDNANFHRMLFHGLRQNAEWHGVPDWHWFPDQKSDLNHEEVAEVINCCRQGKPYRGETRLIDVELGFLRLHRAKQRCSKEVPVIGIADIFAGAVRTSFHEGQEFVSMQRKLASSQDLPLFELEPGESLTRNVEARARVGAHIYNLGSELRQGISLKSQNRLTTRPRPKRFQFWHWEPQSELDKAPTKSRSQR